MLVQMEYSFTLTHTYIIIWTKAQIHTLIQYAVYIYTNTSFMYMHIQVKKNLSDKGIHIVNNVIN